MEDMDECRAPKGGGMARREVLRISGRIRTQYIKRPFNKVGWREEGETALRTGKGAVLDRKWRNMNKF